MRCPHAYKLSVVNGFSPPIPELFGFGRPVHAAVGKLHQAYKDKAPTSDEARAIAENMCHLMIPEANQGAIVHTARPTAPQPSAGRAARRRRTGAASASEQRKVAASLRLRRAASAASYFWPGVGARESRTGARRGRS
ncbi:hypothetical protein [Streptomyces sp. NPDC002599]|uniref:hypothetical protein n=1 Tax=Streptomyces sp. NPDC002599 TaxID=3154421 RepID=UPI00331AD035